jgi:site-specific DNA-cytosine methylase
VSPAAGFIEFFSGIGGMGAAARGAGASILAAFDQDEAANATYAANFGLLPIRANLSSLRLARIAALSANGWLLSPPCQPYTVRGKRRDDEDPRAAALLNLTALLPEAGPEFILLENVPPFAESRCLEKLRTALERAGLHSAQTVLCPTDLGIPNRRRRFYLLASRRPLPPLNMLAVTGDHKCKRQNAKCKVQSGQASWLSATIDHRPSTITYDRRSTRFCLDMVALTGDHPAGLAAPVHPLAEYLDRAPAAELLLSEAHLGRLKWPVNLVRADGIAACFGSSYGRVEWGAGSFLDVSDAGSDGQRRARRFSPEEILRLLHFPSDFAFPPSLSLADRYRLAGNSVNVAVVSFLIRKLLGN